MKMFLKKHLVLILVLFCSVGILKTNQVFTGMQGDVSLGQDDTLYGIAASSGTVTLPSGSVANIEVYGTEINDLNLNSGCLQIGGSGLIIAGALSGSGTITTTDLLNDAAHIIKFKVPFAFNDSIITFTDDITLNFEDNDVEFKSTSLLQLGGDADSITIKNAQISSDNDSWFTLAADELIYFDNVKFNSPLGNTSVSSNNSLNFTGNDNQFNAGFFLPTNTTIATKYPFSGTLELHGKTLSLGSDLTLAADGKFGGWDGTLAVDNEANNRILFFSSDQTYTSLLSVANTMTIDGKFSALDMHGHGTVSIASNKTLKLKDLSLKNLSKSGSGWVRFGNASSKIVFDNVTLYGSLYSKIGQETNITGTLKIGYDSRGGLGVEESVVYPS